MLVGSLEIQLMANIARLQRDMTAARQTVSNATASMERAANAAKAALASIGAGVGLSQIVALSDQYAKFTAQLRLATLSQREYSAAYADVKRIATQSTQGLQETGVLYARIANGTRELGTTQKQVAAITETVNLSLLVSGATASEAASAQLQLSQAFASGTLRGEEFNAVNEAAPRLMLALADGIGVPVGALKKMAEEGQITSRIMSDVLPNALVKLREEAKQIQTIGGAFTVLRNEVMEFVGMQANASGAVSALVSAIGLLSNNLGLFAGIIATLTVSKLVTMFAAWSAETYKQVSANATLRTSTLASAVASTEAAATVSAAKLAEAQANVRAAATAANLANARVTELRTAVLAAEGAVALAVATNGLIPAQARAIALSEALSIAHAQQAIAANAATVAAGAASAALTAQAAATGVLARAMGVLRGAMAFFGGPIGFITTLLGLGATAWMVWGNSAKEANDKATQSVEETHDEVISRIQKQIDKLNERAALAKAQPNLKVENAADLDRLAALWTEYNDAKNGTGKFANADAEYRAVFERIALREHGELLKKLTALQASQTAAAQKGVDARVTAFMKENATKKEQMAAELQAIADLKGKTDQYDEMVRRIRARYADNDAAKVISKEATAYQNLITAANDYIAGLKREREELGLDEDQLRMLNASRAAALAPTAALRREIMESALALTVEKQAVDAAKLGREQYDAAIKAEADARAQEQSSLQDSIDRMQTEIDTYGMGAAAITRYNLAKLEARRADLIAADNYGAEMLAVMDSIDKLTQLEGLQNVRDDLDSLFDTGRVETFGQALRSAFGNAGNALGELTGAFQDYSDRQAAAEMARAKVRMKYGDDEKRIAREVGKINAVEERERVSAYADMAGAAKGFFKENSAGYKVMEAAERTYRAIELANQMQSLYTHLFVTTTKATATATGQGAETAAVVAGEAARNTAKVPGVFMAFMSALGPWGMAAAAVAIAAVLGGAFSGGGVNLSQQRQDAQGTGTVLGSDAKSESIARSLDAIEGATLQGLGISNGMLTSLRNIEAGIGQFASLLVRSTGVTGDFGAEHEAAGFAADFGKKWGGAGIMGKIWSKVLGSVFGGKTTIEDTGFTIDPASFAAIANGGLNAMQYADIKKDGGWFGKDKTSTKTEGLGLEGNRQVASVLLSLYDTVLEAGTMLGLGADDFAAQLNSFVVDIGMVSLKGLSNDEIEKELAAVFSKVGDELASFGVDGLQQFQRVGEGYLETLTRVATNYQAVAVVTDSLGMTFGSLGLASVGARERLIDLVGGLDEFTSSADQFLNDFYTDQERANSLRARLAPTLDQYGIKTGAADSLQQFRSVVTGLDLTTEAGARAYATLMQIAPAFKQIADVDAKIFEERADLQKELDQLTLSETQLLAQQRAALDESNRALFDQIQAVKAKTAADEAATAALEKAKADAAALMGGVDSAFSVLQRVVERQNKALQAEIAVRTKSLQAIQSLSQALRNSLDGMSAKGFDAEDRRSAQAEIQQALAIAKASGVLPNAEDLRRALVVLGKESAGQFANREDYLRDFYTTRLGIEDLAGLTDDALSVEERSLQNLENQVKQLDLMLEREQEQIDILKGISTIGLSIEKALEALRGAMQAAAANPVNSATSAISDAYKSALGRAPDQAGLDYWKDRAAGGISTGAIVDSIKNSPEAQIQKLYQEVFGRSADAAGLSYWTDRLAGGIDLDAIKRTFLDSDEKKGRIPGFMDGGDHVGGWRIVGENGPELEATGPSRIFNAGQTRDLMSRLTSPADNSSALAAAVDRLNATVDRQAAVIARQGAALEQIQRNTRRQADTMDIVTEGGKAMRTKEQGSPA